VIDYSAEIVDTYFRELFGESSQRRKSQEYRDLRRLVFLDVCDLAISGEYQRCTASFDLSSQCSRTAIIVSVFNLNVGGEDTQVEIETNTRAGVRFRFFRLMCDRRLIQAVERDAYKNWVYRDLDTGEIVDFRHPFPDYSLS
jgi:hypothetical protein